ncbi:aryl-alcohol dehydrogenase-like predicted oxidoreductase [Microcella putealis]|uniref:Aryl-alcohol dehydrogenase-like predicted oxidoreductase n=1 Tax=Microcella putealis TaxID=337005 RepID=A0A4V2EXE0_9MICO|nr:aldo/keto reductase [Microcella putealis]RZS59160.1 aryl-alcohol dehydrogenase-like predicted oxidoreductase [Microcella putealis]TQM24186.1 aryl-alcohol dehydrogenase-like predicted oxidoreductase [Microcella putealis]
MTDMTYRSLGDSGLRVSSVGIGCNNFGRPGTATEEQAGAARVMHAAIDHGITLFDTADIYGYAYGRSEEMMGLALAGRRDEIVLATKFGHTDYESPIPHWGARGSRRYVRLAVEQSLTRLKTDWIDLYQLHTPDPLTPIEETLAALDELIDEGKIRYIGHSNFSAWQLVEAELIAQLHGHPRFISAQNEFNLLTRGAEDELLPVADRYGVGFLPWFPLYNGLFTGKFTRDGGPSDSRIMRQRPHLVENAPWDAMERYAAFCADRGVGMLEATIGWMLSRPAMGSVIAGATSIEQVAQNAAAASAWTPSARDLDEIDDIFPRS